ncbi:MAG: hypothetical protein K9N35_00770 [Candidatus Marinimicrobia bacterium]|nr:hypothetical protein [Candidatus Neomarinimicrobiota bacterium]
MRSTGRLLKILIYWFGLIQVLHLMVLIRAGFIYLNQHTIVFPAAPPVLGWTDQSMHFLLAMGIVDSLIIVCSLIAVFGFQTGKSWFPLSGLCASGASIVTALVFALGTIPSTAWQANPWAYAIISILFVPHIFLFMKLYALLSHQLQKVSR